MAVMMIALILLTGLAAGILSGIFGVGGGVVLVPAMVLLLGINQHTAQGISLLVIIPTALTGVWRLHKKGLVDFKLAFCLGGGAMVGAFISANFTQGVASATLKTVFGLFIILLGIKGLMDAQKLKKAAKNKR